MLSSRRVAVCSLPGVGPHPLPWVSVVDCEDLLLRDSFSTEVNIPFSTAAKILGESSTFSETLRLGFSLSGVLLKMGLSLACFTQGNEQVLGHCLHSSPLLWVYC